MKILLSLLVLVAGIGGGFFLRAEFHPQKNISKIAFEKIEYEAAPAQQSQLAPTANAGENCGA